MSVPKNLAASVKARLLAQARSRGETFNDLLTRYCIERLLYRLGESKHADRFLLKGAMLFVLWDDRMPRPTRDVDLLAFGSTDSADVVARFREIVQTEVEPDGLEFDAGTISAEELRDDEAYRGLRVKLIARLGKADIPLQIDLGTGDAVTPGPVDADFPTLLDFPAPHVRAYPIYTVVAEKFEAMVSLGVRNTRMKDFFDVRFLAGRFTFDGATLHVAIRATFERRKTELSASPYPLSDAFAAEPDKQTQWAAFLRRNGLEKAQPDFAAVIRELRHFVGPALVGDPGEWRPARGWAAR
jgi:hypothetical protein